MAEVELADNSMENQDDGGGAPSGGGGGGKLPFGLDMKKLIVIVAAVAIAGFVGFKFFLAPKYQILYSNLDQSDAAAISAYLEKNGHDFKIQEGNSIAVSGVSIAKMRLELASKSLPRGGGVGFEIFDKTNLNISDFNQKINYRRALEGELARTIGSLESVKAAKVHLAMAQKSIFKDQSSGTKASVVITANYGGSLDDNQVKGIQHLVASAVQDLDPNDVQITDQDGNTLVKFMDENSMKQDEFNMNDKKLKAYEAKLEGDLITMLSPILGTGNVLVNVSAEMNFDEAEVNIETFNPIGEDGKKAEPVIRSEKVITEKYSNQNPTKFGTGGKQNAMPSFIHTDRGTAKAGLDDRNYKKQDQVTNYEVSKQIERIKKASGLVSKVSVAVVVNKDLNISERATLKETVRVAAGLDMARGDQVIVTGIKFSSTPYSNMANQQAQKEYDELDRAARFKKYLSLAIIVAIGAGILMLVMISLNAGIDDKRAKEIDSLLKEDDMPILSTIDEKIQEAEEAYHRQLSLESNRTVSGMKQGISQMALQDPKSIANSLAAYINE